MELLSTLRETDYELYQAVVKPIHLASLLPKEVRGLAAYKLLNGKLSSKHIALIAAYKASNQATIPALAYRWFVAPKLIGQRIAPRYQPEASKLEVTRVNKPWIDYLLQDWPSQPHYGGSAQLYLPGFEDIPTVKLPYQVSLPTVQPRLAVQLELLNRHELPTDIGLAWLKMVARYTPSTRPRFHTPIGSLPVKTIPSRATPIGSLALPTTRFYPMGYGSWNGWFKTH